MSVNNTSPTIPVPVSIPITPSFSINDVGVVLSTGSTKPPLQSQVVYQPISKVSINPMPAPANSAPMFVQDNSSIKQPSSSAPMSMANAPIAVSVAPKQVITRLPNQVTQPQKTFGKHQLPVRSVPASASVTPQVIPRSTSAANTVTTALLDPGGGGGGFPPKAVALQSAIIPGAKQKLQAQHVLMAPGLRTPAPIKYSQFQPTTFSSVSYQIPNQQQTATTLAVKPLQSGNRVQQPLVVRPIFQQSRPIPLAVATTQEAPRRPSSVLHQPTTTISISVSARPNSQQEPVQLINATSRVSVTSTAGGKSVYQVSIASSSGVSPLSGAPKGTRKVMTPRTIITNSVINRTASTSSAPSSIATSVTSFTYSAAPSRLASIASITTSAVAKVFPQPPSVSGISAHVRTTEFNQSASLVRHTQPSTVTTNQSSSSGSAVVASVAASSRTVASVMQPMIYMPQAPGISLSFPYHTPTATSYTSLGPGIRPALNISAPNQSAPIRLSSNLLVMEAPRLGTAQSNIAAFTQGQKILQTVPATQTGGSDQPRMLPPNMASGQVPTGIQHVPNMSPKPAILRRPIRSDTSITKKLNFTSESRAPDRGSPIKTEQRNSSDGSSNIHAPSKRYSHEVTYSVTSNIKPALAGQVKPTVTSNGLGHPLKLQSNNTNIPYVKTEPGSGPHGRVTNSNIDEQKMGVEQGFSNVPFSIKTETVSGQISQQRFHPTTTYHLQGNKQSQDGNSSQHQQVIHQPVSKVRQLQQRVTVTATPKIIPAHQSQHSVSSPALPNNMLIRQVNSNTAMHYRAGELHQTSIHNESKLKLSDSAPAGTLKRAYDKIVTPLPRDDCLGPNLEQQNSHFIQNSAHINLSNSAHDPLMGLSPRKKPRKQTHVIAEELPENVQMIDDEMSTDDADECEDEQPSVMAASNTQENSKLGSSKGSNRLLPDSGQFDIKPVVTTIVKPTTEYTDEDGVRYVVVRERPPINLLNGHRTRAVNNHFTHYSDVKVKEKKITFQDQCFDLNRMKGWKVKHLAIQLDELRTLDANALERFERVKNGLLQHCQAMLSTDATPCEVGCKSPAQILSLPTSVATTTPTQARNLSTTFSKPFSSTNVGESSPLTPLERRASRIREEILKTEEMAQANIQRCNVMQEQLSELKAIFVKVLDNRDLATKLVEAGRVSQKSSKTVGSNGVRTAKKKKS